MCRVSSDVVTSTCFALKTRFAVAMADDVDA